MQCIPEHTKYFFSIKINGYYKGTVFSTLRCLTYLESQANHFYGLIEVCDRVNMTNKNLRLH